MDVLALILACSLHPDDELIRVLADVQRGGNIYFVGDLSTLKSNDSLSTAVDALHAAEEIVRHGGRPAVGLLGLPFDWAGRFGLAPSDLFDGCTNVAVGSAALMDYQDLCSRLSPSRHPWNDRRPLGRRRSRPSADRLRACVLRRFSRDLGVEGAPAVILNAIARRRRSGLAEQAQPPQTSPIFRDRGADSVEDGISESAGARVFVTPTGRRF